MRRTRTRSIRREITGLLLGLCLLPVVSVAEIGPAFTGLTGRADDASAAFFSPAGITRLDRPEVAIQTIVAYAVAEFDVDEATIEGGDADKDDRVLVVPGVFYVRPFSEDWHLGVSVNVPSGLGFDYGKSWSGRYLAEESTLTFLAASASLAHRVTSKWSVAAGPFLMYTDSKVKARVNNLNPDAGDGSVRLEESGAAFGFSLGTMFEFSESTRLGVNYRSSADPKLEGTPSFSNLDPLLREILAAADLLGTEVDIDFNIPATAAAGFYTELSERWSMTGDLIWINMSDFGVTRISVEQDSISVNEGDYRDTWIGTAGVKYRYREDRAIALGAMYGTSPISDGKRGIGLPLDRVVGFGVGIERPCRDYLCHINLNYLDLGDGDLAVEGGPLTGSIAGSFDKNWALMLDFQVGIRL